MQKRKLLEKKTKRQTPKEEQWPTDTKRTQQIRLPPVMHGLGPRSGPLQKHHETFCHVLIFIVMID